MTSSLVGSEMCIRDRAMPTIQATCLFVLIADTGTRRRGVGTAIEAPKTVSYTHLTLPTICSV
eukprot:4500075-Prorocentrum_lima.AAC.1